MVGRAEGVRQGHAARPDAVLKGALGAEMARCSNGQRGRISGILLQAWQVSLDDGYHPLDAINAIAGNQNKSKVAAKQGYQTPPGSRLTHRSRLLKPRLHSEKSSP